MMTNPPEAPKINWEAYKKIVPVPGLVDKFKQQYEALKIPYPEDKYTSDVAKEWVALQPEIKKYTDEMQAHIDKFVSLLSLVHSLSLIDLSMFLVQQLLSYRSGIWRIILL